MDKVIEAQVNEMQYTRHVDKLYYHAPVTSGLMFTRLPKNEVDTFPYEPFSDGGSRDLRTPFPRGDYVIQNPLNGGGVVRGIPPRMRPA